ncbi:MAG: type VI secretion system secreted protein Hcp [Glomeribacter sp. 1016415]|uniref:Uncharacterized protein n=1 Tax=Mycoavidus cysteinexigens TaxID=1553431 RepID=A0A2Z6EY54_9BURK|nr:type VI secretion system tube protein Hcp [Mycoavidus cysteinexigens]MCX8566524.1 type VI secretion system secreted protein Hcp [Glomeribacter sp. 1016415]BBE10055.1 Uncharacterized protein MCB1EB_1894 [Mycoavidus cysteinexigens]GAM53603.1 uncharacterized protein ImpD [bacterium endosymbiont of Mortierella elongata FMR23-6]GLR00471.1 protein hcp1 [Mycoavidus cysteinexigens]
MAADIFLKLGDVKGESIDHTHKDEIEVLSWSWGANQSATFHEGTGGGSGKGSIKNLSIAKYMDQSSPTLFQLCVSGQHIESAQLTVRKAGGKSPLEYFKLKLKKVLISSYATGGSGGMDRITENISLNFAEVEAVYQPQDTTGAKKGGEVTGKWNIPANAEA